MDGIRGYWNGECLVTRQGNSVNAPDWFVAPLHQVVALPLDGELWMGVGTDSKDVMSVVRAKESEGWRSVTYSVFDLPSLVDVPVEHRFAQLQHMKPLFPSHVSLVE